MEKSVALDQLILDADVNIRADVDEATVLRYMEVFENLPPVLVVDTKGFEPEQELILVDGFHRVEAALRLGNKRIRSEIRKGPRELAIELAATANMAHGLPLHYFELELAVNRLVRLGKTQRQVAELFGMAPSTVSGYVTSYKTRMNTGSRMSPEQLRHIGLAPKEAQSELAKQAEKLGMSTTELRAIAKQLRDARGKLDVQDVIGEARPHLREMKDRQRFVRMFEASLEDLRQLDAIGVTPARILSYAQTGEQVEEWRQEAKTGVQFLQAFLKSLDKNKGMRVVN